MQLFYVGKIYETFDFSFMCVSIITRYRSFLQPKLFNVKIYVETNNT